jgi:hypothetical protein
MSSGSTKNDYPTRVVLLGHHIVRSSFRGIQPGEHPLSVANKLADVMVPPPVTGESYPT